MLEKSAVNWTSKILSNARKGLSDRALSYFLEMMRTGIQPYETTFSITIGISTHLQSPNFGPSLHCLILKKGFSRNLFVSSGLITMHSRLGCIAQARQVFDEMPDQDPVSWNSMIAGYVQNGFDTEACVLFHKMVMGCKNLSLFVSNFALASILKACGSLGCGSVGKSVHGYAIKTCLDSDIFVSASTIDMYSKCGSFNMACCVFDRLKKRDLVVWNTMITGCVNNCYDEEAIELFYQLKREGFVPNETTYPCVLKASTAMLDSSFGRCFHAQTLKSGYSLDVFVGTAVVDMYSKFFKMEDAKSAFGEMNRKNLITFNALVTGYGLVGEHKEAISAYILLHTEGFRPDAFTLMGLFSSCTLRNAVAEGSQVHCHSIMLGLEPDVFVGNSITNFYFKCGLVDCALKAFEVIYAPNTVSWAGIISGFVQNVEGEKALKCFREMHKLCERADEFSSSSSLKAITSSSSIDSGKHLHSHVLKLGLVGTSVVGSALIDMYSKCGMTEDARKVFAEVSEKNAVCWNSMITGYAHNGFCLEALLLFQEMGDLGILPTPITFVGVLFACSHAGLVDEGKNYYGSMVYDYEIPPSIEHSTCMVDLLGRAGYLDEAETFLLNSPYSKEPEVWGCLLAACQVHNNTNVGSRAAQHCSSLQGSSSSSYTVLSNLYASNSLWYEVEKVRNFMQENKIEKESGCSRIEV